MGHSDISVTMNIYNEATKEKKEEAFKNLENKMEISWFILRQNLRQMTEKMREFLKKYKIPNL